MKRIEEPPLRQAVMIRFDDGTFQIAKKKAKEYENNLSMAIRQIVREWDKNSVKEKKPE